MAKTLFEKERLDRVKENKEKEQKMLEERRIKLE